MGMEEEFIGEPEHDGSTFKNSLHTIHRVAVYLNKNISDDDDIPEWVAEKMGAAKGMLTSIMQYLISEKEMHRDQSSMFEQGVTEGVADMHSNELLNTVRGAIRKAIKETGDQSLSKIFVCLRSARPASEALKNITSPISLEALDNALHEVGIDFDDLLNFINKQAEIYGKQGVTEGLDRLDSFTRKVLDRMQDDSWLSAERAYFIQKGAQEKAQRNREQYNQEIQRFIDLYRQYKGQQVVAEGSTGLSIQQLATISDEALDKAYGYGRSTPGNSFGWQANLKSAAYAKHMIDKGVTDIEAISDAIHKGWNVTAQAFVQNPEQFDDTAKLKAAGKLEAKLQQRAQLMKQNYAQLPEDEKEKDRVVARALLQSIKGQQGVAEAPDYAAMYESTLVEFAGGMGAGSVATAPGVGKGSNVGSLFGGSYSQKNSPFKKTKAKKESVIKR
jgi:hypothetical protein